MKSGPIFLAALLSFGTFLAPILFGQETPSPCITPEQELVYTVSFTFQTNTPPDVTQEDLETLRAGLLGAICQALCGRDSCGLRASATGIPAVPGYLRTPIHLMTVPIPEQTKEGAKAIRKQCEAVFRQYNKSHKPYLAGSVWVGPTHPPVPESVKKRELAVLHPGETVTATMLVSSFGVVPDRIEPGEHPDKEALVLTFRDDSGGLCLVAKNMTVNGLVVDFSFRFEDGTPELKRMEIPEKGEAVVCEGKRRPIAVVVHRIKHPEPFD